MARFVLCEHPPKLRVLKPLTTTWATDFSDARLYSVASFECLVMSLCSTSWRLGRTPTLVLSQSRIVTYSIG